MSGRVIFLATSADLPVQARRRLASVVARDAFVLLVAAMLVGSYVLAFFGISLPVVRVAGGLDAWQRKVGRRGFYPLTFPLTVGPGRFRLRLR